MTHFVASLGFSTEPVVRPIMAHGVADGDQVDLIHPNQTGDAKGRVESVTTDIRNTFQTVGDNISVTQYPVEIDPFTSISACSERLGELTRQGTTAPVEDEDIVVVLGGGSNEIVAGLLTATIAHLDAIETVLVYGNARSESFEVSLPKLTARVPGHTRETFATLVQADEPLSLSELAEMTDASQSTVGRHVDALESEGLVSTEREGGHRLARITETAGILLDAGVVNTDSVT